MKTHEQKEPNLLYGQILNVKKKITKNNVWFKISQIEHQLVMLEKHYKFKAKGALLRSEQDWVVKSETNTAYV